MTFVTKENTQDIYVLTPTQKGMLFHTIYDEATPVYFEQFSFTIQGPLDIRSFRQAWDHLIAITPVLRTVFKWTKVKEPVQIVLKNLPVDLVVHNLDHLEQVAQAKSIREFRAHDKQTPFPMEEGPLLRLNLFVLGKEKHHFLWSYHHILIDGWCMPLIMKDLVEIYMAALARIPLPRPARRPYRDYIGWFLKQNQEKALKFWKESLGDLAAPTSLPMDRLPAQDVATFSEEVRLELAPELTRKVQDLAKRQRVTQSTLVQAVWSLLLSRYSRQNDVVFGVTVSGRPADLQGSEDMIGLFINTLPMRVRLSAEMTVSELLQSVQEFANALREYEYSPLSDLKACTAISKSQNLFDSFVVFENYPVDAIGSAPDSRFGLSEISTVEMTNFPLTMIVSPGEHLRIEMHYYTSLFDRVTVERMLGHMREVLVAMVDNPEAKVSQVEILSQEEKQQILIDFNQTDSPYSQDKCPYQLFEEQADKTPEHVAVTFEEQALTYRELNARANQLAHYLRQKGVVKESKIGLMVERSLDMLVGVLGIQKAGGAYVPMDPEYPKARLEYMLEDSESPVLVTQSALLAGLSKPPKQAVCLDVDWDAIAKQSRENPVPLAGPENISHLIYTSGSTGLPKGVMIEHRNVTAFLYWCLEEFRHDEYEKMIASTSMCFDLSVFEFLLPLITGAHVIILRSSLDLDEFLEQNTATMINTVPSALKHLLSVMDKRHRIKAINLAGEPLKLELVKDAYAKLDVDIIRNLYGPTEDTTYSTGYRVPKDSDRQPLIGRPIFNSKAYIVDQHLKPVPVGVIGEIYLTGHGLARGYWNAPEKTSQRFIPNPFHLDFCPVMYKTGDLGKWLHDGNIEFHGRVDYQVKIRGNRIEMGEIEARLAQHSEIKDIVVMDKEDSEGNKFLVAYYVADAEISTTDLRAFIKETLPDYMVPSRFVRLDILPLTPNGKVDRKALPDVEGVRPEVGSVYIEPRNEVEQALSEVWKDVLGLDRVGVNDNFFDLGGDSIISLQVVGRLKKRGFDMRPKDIFEHQTIAELALVVGKGKTLKAEQGPIVGQAPLIPIQRWFFDLRLANEHHFNQFLVFKTAMQLNPAALKQALQAVIDHHDTLRVRFMIDAQEFMPLGEEVAFVVKDVQNDAELTQAVNALQNSLNIIRGPVFTAGLYRKGTVEYLAFAAHHLVVDGVSWRILLEDLFTGYGAAVKGNTILLPEKTTSYLEWALRLNEYAIKVDLQDELASWKQELLQAAGHTFPLDHDRGENDVASSASLRVELGEEYTDYLLKSAHKAYNTEVNDLLITALMRALAAWTGQNTVLFNLEGHGREDIIEGIDISRTVGWFTTLFPLALHAGNDDPGKQIKYVKEKLRIIPYKGFNYGIIKYILKDDRLPEIHPPVVFNYLGQLQKSELEGAFDLTDEIKADSNDPRNLLAHLVTINCKVEDAKLLVDISFSRNKYEDPTLQSLAQKFVTELAEVVQCCMRSETVGYTPSDFELAEITQDQLEGIIEDLEDV